MFGEQDEWHPQLATPLEQETDGRTAPLMKPALHVVLQPVPELVVPPLLLQFPTAPFVGAAMVQVLITFVLALHVKRSETTPSTQVVFALLFGSKPSLHVFWHSFPQSRVFPQVPRAPFAGTAAVLQGFWAHVACVSVPPMHLASVQVYLASTEPQLQV